MATKHENKGLQDSWIAAVNKDPIDLKEVIASTTTEAHGLLNERLVNNPIINWQLLREKQEIVNKDGGLKALDAYVENAVYASAFEGSGIFSPSSYIKARDHAGERFVSAVGRLPDLLISGKAEDVLDAIDKKITSITGKIAKHGGVSFISEGGC